MKRPRSLPVGFPKKGPKVLVANMTDEEWAANCFLSGFDQMFSAKGEPINFDPYPEPVFVRVSFLKGQLEEFGREAFVRLLRDNKLSDVLRHSLADLFDRNSTDDRKLIFKRRFRHQPSDSRTKDRTIAHYIQQKMRTGEKWDGAVKLAREEFGRNGKRAARSTITDAWARDQERYPDYHLPKKKKKGSVRSD
jgi:hypothetical protein